ncbi:serine/threonine-protein kinase, partial [Pseudonocardia oceani]
MPQQQGAAAGWVGHVLAGHRIDALVGEGGMGVVYRATHLNLRRTVALKVLSPALAADLEYRRRFEREATIAASLEHPAVVPIYDAGHANGVLFLSMRFIEGDDLGAVLQREGPLDVTRLCALLGPVADALDAVHEAGLVHRDVKPGNVLISRPGRSRSGQVYLCDFGIARGRTDPGSDITAAGRYLGTLQYSSPEQIQGKWIDGRSDQYGLACLVHRGLTGQVPYPRDDTAAVIYAHLAADPPRPSLLRPDLPPAVDDVLA